MITDQCTVGAKRSAHTHFEFNYRDVSVSVAENDIALNLLFVLQDDSLQDFDSFLKFDDEGQFSQNSQVFHVGVGQEKSLFLVHLLGVEKRGGSKRSHLENHLMSSEEKREGKGNRGEERTVID